MNDTLPLQVAAEVLAEIRRQERTMTSVADAADIHRVSLGRKCKGQTDFYMAEFLRVCAVLGCQPSALIAKAEVDA